MAGEEIKAVAESGGTRLDVFVAEKAECTRSHAKNLIEEGNVTVNGIKAAKSGALLKAGDVVVIVNPAPKELDLSPQDIPIEIVWQDEDFAVVNKPQGMVVHPAPGAYDNTLVNALLFKLSSLSGINGVARPGIVHRLDKDTSGLLVVAKNDYAHISLQKQIAEKSAKRYYYALVDGVVQKDSGEIRNFLARSTADRKKYAVAKDGRLAITLYKVVKRYSVYTLMEYELKTGRTHQIRVHSRYIGHPVVGDRTYGGSDAFGLNGQLLHAYKLVLTHPRTGEEMTFTAPLPDYFQSVLDKLKPIG
ncbi:MAG TPA: RluA family pseudouridine synthase [Candidatus Ornithoclostridium faecavium]|nr:RluA family pseudouridine synthase [Candidatus Ornithoclostridium faecavium]